MFPFPRNAPVLFAFKSVFALGITVIADKSREKEGDTKLPVLN